MFVKKLRLGVSVYNGDLFGLSPYLCILDGLLGEWMGVSTVDAGRQALESGEFRQAVREATSIKDPP